MFAGHIGVALAIGRNEKRINVGVFVTAALFMDLVLWVFVLSGLESIVIPANFSSSHQPEYGFPYSHGLIASVLWSIVAAALGIFTCFRLGAAKWRAGGLIAISLFSHWVLDALVHQPELPLAGVGSSKVGFGLWQNMPVALVIESSLVLIGLFLFVRNSNLSRGKLIALGVLSLVILTFTVFGMTIAPPAPSVFAMAGSTLATNILVCGLAFWCGKLPPVRQENSSIGRTA